MFSFFKLLSFLLTYFSYKPHFSCEILSNACPVNFNHNIDMLVSIATIKWYISNLQKKKRVVSQMSFDC